MTSAIEGKKDQFLVTDDVYETFKKSLPKYSLASDLMSRDIATINPEASLDKAAQIMGDKHVGSLIVEKYKTPVGIITERDLLSKVFALGLFLTDERVEDIMSYPLAGVSVFATIKEVAQIMIKKKSRLAVYDAGTLKGVITTSDIVKTLPEIPEYSAKVDDYMTKVVILADEEISVNSIAAMMGRQRIGSVIITRKEEPIGIFTERDLLTSFLAKGRALYTEVGPECSKPIITIPSGLSVHKAAATMAIKHIRRLPVVKDDKIIGIVTARDLIEAYVK